MIVKYLMKNDLYMYNIAKNAIQFILFCVFCYKMRKNMLTNGTNKAIMFIVNRKHTNSIDLI